MSRRKRSLAVLTTGRQDFGILRSTLLALREHDDFDVRLWVGGMHLSPQHGESWRDVVSAGFAIDQRLALQEGSLDDPVRATSESLQLIGDALHTHAPWALLLVGDRTETLAAAVAATLARVPIVHLHGGEETEGAIDNACRHAITKLSHLHLVSHPVHRARVEQMGEHPSHVHVVGAPGLDNRFRADLPTMRELAGRLGVALEDPVALVTVHPTTLQAGASTAEVAAVATALASWPGTIVVTQPNNDAGGAAIREFWRAWAEANPQHVVVDALGEAGYWGLLQHVAVVVGNSSSGVIEAPFAGVPSVNVGDRQAGRLRFAHTVDVPAEPQAIAAAIANALSIGRFAPGSTGIPEGPAAPRIVAALQGFEPSLPPRKRFRDLA